MMILKTIKAMCENDIRIQEEKFEFEKSELSTITQEEIDNLKLR